MRKLFENSVGRIFIEEKPHTNTPVVIVRIMIQDDFYRFIPDKYSEFMNKDVKTPTYYYGSNKNFEGFIVRESKAFNLSREYKEVENVTKKFVEILKKAEKNKDSYNKTLNEGIKDLHTTISEST